MLVELRMGERGVRKRWNTVASGSVLLAAACGSSVKDLGSKGDPGGGGANADAGDAGGEVPAPTDKDAGTGSGETTTEDADSTSSDGTSMGATESNEAPTDIDGGESSETIEIATEDGGAPVNGTCRSSVMGEARRAVSKGFSGTEDQYFALYDVECENVDDCLDACLSAGGIAEMCVESECLEAFGAEPRTCLPAPVWRNLDSILFEAITPLDGIELTMVSTAYRDILLTDEFGLEVPEDATIRGIQVDLLRAGSNRVVDYSVRLESAGQAVPVERAKQDRWSYGLEWVTYGGDADLWGRQWTPEVLNATDFGVALALYYTEASGNTRAYVDRVQVTVHYDAPCEE